MSLANRLLTFHQHFIDNSIKMKGGANSSLTDKLTGDEFLIFLHFLPKLTNCQKQRNYTYSLSVMEFYYLNLKTFYGNGNLTTAMISHILFNYDITTWI